MMHQQAPWVFSPSFYESHPEQLTEILTEMERSPQPAAAFAAQIAALLDLRSRGPARISAHACAGDRS